jgi:RNA polymerase-binding protein DksA
MALTAWQRLVCRYRMHPVKSVSLSSSNVNTSRAGREATMIKSHEELKTVLVQQRKALRAKVENLNTTALDGTGYTNHQADDATQAFDQAADLALRTSTQKTLRLVEDALVKFGNGTYGVCERCGQEIDIARLEAIPYTPYCLHCAESREFHGK